mmetsp:Transcript_68686/g.138119  ORF Transcript_68686/g.138119 Transcript_68686/m.138119 type:complete len:551 (+) Transcript_68686:116-1768(+)
MRERGREWVENRFLKQEEDGDLHGSDVSLSETEVKIISYTVSFTILAVFAALSVLRTLHAKAFLSDLRKGSRDAVSDGMRIRPVKSLQICSAVTSWAFVLTVVFRILNPVANPSRWTFIPMVFSGYIGDIGIMWWFLLRERSLYCPMFNTPRCALKVAYVLVFLYTCGCVTELTWWIIAKSSSFERPPEWFWPSFSVLQVPINFLAAYIYVRPFVKRGVSVALSPVLKELLARTCLGLFFYLGSWIGFWTWVAVAPRSCDVKNCVMANVWAAILFFCRCSPIFISHRDDVPVRKELARLDLSSPRGCCSCLLGCCCAPCAVGLACTRSGTKACCPLSGHNDDGYDGNERTQRRGHAESFLFRLGSFRRGSGGEGGQKTPPSPGGGNGGDGSGCNGCKGGGGKEGSGGGVQEMASGAGTPSPGTKNTKNGSKQPAAGGPNDLAGVDVEEFEEDAVYGNGSDNNRGRESVGRSSVTAFRESLSALQEGAVVTAREEWGAGLAGSDAFAQPDQEPELDAHAWAVRQHVLGGAKGKAQKTERHSSVVVSEGVDV